MSGSKGDLFIKMLKENGIETIFMIVENKTIGYLREDSGGKTYITEHTFPWADPPNQQPRIHRKRALAGKLYAGGKTTRPPNKRMKVTLGPATGNFIELPDERGVQLHATLTGSVMVQNALPPPMVGNNTGGTVDSNTVRTEANNGVGGNSSTVVIVNAGRVGVPETNAAVRANTQMIVSPSPNILRAGMDGRTILPAITINVQQRNASQMDIEELDDDAVVGSDDEDAAEEKKENGSISSCTLSSDEKCSCAKCEEKKMPGESGSAVVSGQSDGKCDCSVDRESVLFVANVKLSARKPKP